MYMCTFDMVHCSSLGFKGHCGIDSTLFQYNSPPANFSPTEGGPGEGGRGRERRREGEMGEGRERKEVLILSFFSPD